MMRKLAGLLRAFQDAGIYDEMAILIVSDHGLPTVDLAPEVAKPPLPPPKPNQASALTGVSMGVPLFLVKAPNARGPLRISDRPVSLCDVPATTVAMLQIPETAPIRLRERAHPRAAHTSTPLPIPRLRPAKPPAKRPPVLLRLPNLPGRRPQLALQLLGHSEPISRTERSAPATPGAGFVSPIVKIRTCGGRSLPDTRLRAATRRSALAQILASSPSKGVPKPNPARKELRAA